MRRVACLAVALASGCRDGPAPEPFVAAAGGRAPGAFDGEVVFADGMKIGGVTLEPAVLVPGAPVTVRFVVSGTDGGGAITMGLAPPHAVGRQVALGGVGAPPATVAADPRSVTAALDPAIGSASVRFDMPAVFHPRNAVITAERSSPAVGGPRTEGGVAVLAVAAVALRPTPVRAAAAAAGVAVDAALDDEVWRQAEKTQLVTSLDGEPLQTAKTDVRFAWDADALYVAAELRDDDIWSNYEAQDDPLWKEEVLEVFVFGAGDAPPTRSRYLELQISPRAVTFDARFERYRKGDEAWDSGWQTAVDLRGTVDDRRDRDQGWSVEAAIPWTEICEHTTFACPPAAGSALRINVFRFDRPRKGPPVAGALSPTREPDFHAPDNAAILELAP